MRFSIAEEDNTTLFISFEGRLDFAGVEAISKEFKELLQTRKKNVVLDASGITFIASMGMSFLVSAAKMLRDEGCVMVLFSPEKKVRDIWRMAALEMVLPLVREKKQALEMIEKLKAAL